ncbi:9864_t:CDS:2, partial [Funneliformis mosseae]
HGIKVLYYIVIPVTLVCPRFSNLSPVFDKSNLNCNSDQWRLQAYRCKAYISSTFFCFVMTLTWIMSTASLIIYFHTIKEEAANNNKEFEDNENV